MTITLNGQLHDVMTSEKTDRATGVITQEFTAEVLHKSRGKSVIDSVKLDASVFEAWSKVKGREISCEVRFYAMRSNEGVISGLTLADKKSLPLLLDAPKLKAA